MPGRFGIRSLVRRLAAILRPAEPLVPNQLRPIAATEPADVFLVAYPKSGVTWLQSLVAGAVYGLDPGQAPDALIQDLVPDVHYKAYFKRYRTPMLFKTHHLPQASYRQVVYLLRDGRDVMVSYWHHLQAMGRTEVDFARMVAGEGLYPCRWHEHVEAWMANPFGARILTIRYEDLKADAARELARFCAFVDEPREPAELERVARQCAFEAMQRKEARFGWDNPAWPKDRPFVRRGEPGSFRDEMPAAVLARFLAEAGPTLAQQGYPLAG